MDAATLYIVLTLPNGEQQSSIQKFPPNPITRRRKTISRSKIGSVSQATKVAQAVRDARGTGSKVN